MQMFAIDIYFTCIHKTVNSILSNTKMNSMLEVWIFQYLSIQFKFNSWGHDSIQNYFRFKLDSWFGI